jgi:hypothetical protein
VVLYERYFTKARFIPVSTALVAQAHIEACTSGLSALDALHTTFAQAGGAEECITTESQTTPLFRVTRMIITPLILSS